MAIDRRVYAPEFRGVLGYSETWFRMQREKGVITPGHLDPGGRRLWWLESEVVEQLERMKNGSTPPSKKAAA